MLIYERFIARMCCFILKTQLAYYQTRILAYSQTCKLTQFLCGFKARKFDSLTVGEFDSLTVGEFDSLTVGTRVAKPPGVASA